MGDCSDNQKVTPKKSSKKTKGILDRVKDKVGLKSDKDDKKWTKKKIEALLEEQLEAGTISADDLEKMVMGDEGSAKTFLDHIDQADKKLSTMINTKTKDLDNESGKEEENRMKLSILKTQMHHLESIAESAVEYDNL